MRVSLVTAVLLVTLLPAPSPAGRVTPPDPCQDQAASRKGGWVQGNDAGGAGAPATSRNRAGVNAILDEIAALVKAAYPEPAGSQGKVYRNYGLEPFLTDGIATYELTANFKGYGCDRRRVPAGEVTMHTETATWLYVQVNSYWPASPRFEYRQYFLSPEDHQNLVTLQPVRVLRTPSPADRDRKPIDASLPPSVTAFPHFTFEGEYDSSESSYRTREVLQTVFLTPDGGLPYDPVTVGDFLDVNEARLKAYIRANEQYGGMESYQELLPRIPELRKRYGSRLGQTAYIRGFSWSESDLRQDDPFLDEGSGYMLARRSPRYLGDGDPYRPRFIAVTWRWQPEVPYSVRVHEAIRDNLDFGRLAAMLVR